MSERARRPVVAVAVVAVLTLALWLGVTPAHAAGDVQVDTQINGRAVSKSTDAHPTRLDPTKPTTVVVTVRNGGSAPVTVKTVRIEGRALGLAFFSYDTSVGMRVAPGGTARRTFQLDLGGLKGQAVGLIPGTVKLLDDKRHVVGSQSMVTDVRGSLRSVYGMFGIFVAIFTGLSLARAIYELATHRLPANRWWRAVRFAVPGLGIGLIAVFTLSATRVFAPSPSHWLPIVLITTGAGFGLGYITPTPDDEADAAEPDVELAGGTDAVDTDQPGVPAAEFPAAGATVLP